MSKQKKSTAKSTKTKGAKSSTAVTKAPPAPNAKVPKANGAKANGKRRGNGVLDGAAKVLAEAKKPMQCKQIVEKLLTAKLWSTSGKTPAATLYAAIIREIRDKGKAARFKKTGRGQFAVNATTPATSSTKRGAA